jgi:uncharacterized protein (DUF488 family)
MDNVTLFTIGFTQKNAEQFFSALRQASVKRLIDVRLNNVSQLAGFAKRDDLAFFLREICGCDYEHRTGFAPTKDMLDGYKAATMSWQEYERAFTALMSHRHIEKQVELGHLDHACLLCSEPTPQNCHRRLVAEYLKAQLGHIQILHL